MATEQTIWLVSVVTAFLLYRILSRRTKQPAASDYEREINEILTNDKYKVKGRFEE